MPQKKSKPEPPVMTRGDAMPVLVIAVVFDAARLFFNFFWFLGPALAAAYCTLKAGATLSTWTLGLAGTKTAAALCSLGAGAIGAAGVELTGPFGVVMADAVGLAGFLVLGLLVIMTNARLFKTVENAPLQFAAAFAVGEIPLIGSLPVFSFIAWRLYGAQIAAETAAHEKWEKESAETSRQEQEQQAAQVAQIRVAQVAEANQQAENEAVYAEAANDEIPEDLRKAA